MAAQSRGQTGRRPAGAHPVVGRGHLRRCGTHKNADSAGAVAAGDPALAERLLASAPVVGGNYQNRLLLLAEASQQAGWKVVEREEVETLLRERDFANPWAKGRHDFSAMGDRLSADVLVFVSQLKSDKLTVLRFEAVDVLSGLAIERRHVDAKEFKPAQFANDYLAAVRSKLQERLEGRSLTAVTLLALTADAKVPSQRLLEASLRTGLLGAIDATPGMISVSADAMFKHAESENTMLTWLLRLAGFVLMAIGFGLILKPFSVLGDVIPLIGNIIGTGGALISMLLSFVISIIVIAVAWFVVRPLLSIALLVVAVAGIVMAWRRGSARKAARA